MGNEQDLKVAYGITYKPSQVSSLKKDGDKVKIDLNNGVTIWTSPQKKGNKAVIEAILFTMGESVELEKIADTIELDKNKRHDR